MTWLAALLLGCALAVVVRAAVRRAVGPALGLRARALFGGVEPRSWRGAKLALAAVVANLVVSIALIFVADACGGPLGLVYVIDDTVPGGPADGRLRRDDVVLALDGVEQLADAKGGLQKRIDALGERPIRFTISRDRRIVDVDITPARDPESGSLRIGVLLGMSRWKRRPLPAGAALAGAAAFPFRHAALVAGLSVWDDRSASPVRIIEYALRGDYLVDDWPAFVEPVAATQVPIFWLLFLADVIVWLVPARRRPGEVADGGSDALS